MNIEEWEKQLRLILKNRLSIRKNPQYLQWIAEFGDLSMHGDHICKKSMDLLIAKRKPSEHLYREYHDYTENYLQSLENLFNYVEYLQKKLVDNHIKF